MELAIASGNPAAVSALVDKLENNSAAQGQLTGCYGGRYFKGRGRRGVRLDIEWGFDDNGLLSMTNPLLHAARTGSPTMFTEVVYAMRKKLRPQQVRVAQS